VNSVAGFAALEPGHAIGTIESFAAETREKLMPKGLPPLTALRAFEAAARHANLARAALELNVTPGALSHQVRALEALLGATLFERQARGVALTPQGRLLYPGLAAGFGLIGDAVQALRASARSGVLVVSTPPGFTSKWLAPRLYRFAEAHPEVELRIASSAAYAHFARDGVDVAIRSLPEGASHDPALAHEKLLDDTLVAVCSPPLLAKLQRPGGGRELRGVPLIHDDQLAGRSDAPGWVDWLEAAGLAAPDLRRGLRFSSADHALDAAVQGAGLLLTHAVLAHDALQAGRLVQPFDVVVPARRAYFLVRPASRPQPAAEAFATWLRAEMAAMAAPRPRAKIGARRARRA
jgi:LysR family glycine cleavage system transcriptional activator